MSKKMTLIEALGCVIRVHLEGNTGRLWFCCLVAAEVYSEAIKTRHPEYGDIHGPYNSPVINDGENWYEVRYPKGCISPREN